MSTSKHRHQDKNRTVPTMEFHLPLPQERLARAAEATHDLFEQVRGEQNKEKVIEALSRGADPNAIDASGYSVAQNLRKPEKHRKGRGIQWLIDASNYNACWSILQANGADLKGVDAIKAPGVGVCVDPYHLIGSQHLKSCDLELDKGLDVPVISEREATRHLLQAVKHGSKAEVFAAIEAGADVRCRNKKGRTLAQLLRKPDFSDHLSNQEIFDEIARYNETLNILKRYGADTKGIERVQLEARESGTIVTYNSQSFMLSYSEESRMPELVPTAINYRDMVSSGDVISAKSGCCRVM